MKKNLALVVGAALASGCGSKTLDIGGASGSGAADDGGPVGTAGTHSTVLIPHQRDIAGLASEGSYLYWLSVDGLAAESAREIRRCDKHDCMATQQVLFRASSVAGLLIRNETLYFSSLGSIVSCPVSDCTTPKVVVAKGDTPAIVDDSHVFWWTRSDNAFLSCPLSGCEKATAAPATGVGTVLAFGADDANLYWITRSGRPAVESCSLLSAPKDGSIVPRTLASDLTKAPSLAVEEGFVYWATLESQGKIARCPTSGCSGAPDVLLDQQYYPHYLTFSNGVLFWLNETDPADKLTAINRPAKLLGCVAASCAETVEVLDEARGGSVFDPIHALSYGSQQMVADSEAVYWIGDVTPLTSGSMVTGIDASIRRLPRKPGK